MNSCAYLRQYVEHIPLELIGGYFNIMDICSRYVAINTPTLKLIGYTHADQVHNTSYYDMPCKAAESADLFVNENAKVMSSKKPLKVLSYESLEQGDATVMIGEKHPLIINDEIVGVSVHFIDISNLRLIDLGRFLMKSDARYHGKTQPFHHSFILDDHYEDYGLSPRQAECLFLLLRGSSSKVIARILGISYRTVEGYINEIKIKMGCDSKSQIIEKAISEGLLNYLPESMISILTA